MRAADADTADAVARTLVESGLTAFEFTATTPGWEGLVTAWAKEFPEVTLGLGTVTSTDIAERALAAGANFLVSPFQVPEVRPVADAAGRLLVSVDDAATWLDAGAFTVSIGSHLTRGDVAANVARLKERIAR